MVNVLVFVGKSALDQDQVGEKTPPGLMRKINDNWLVVQGLGPQNATGAVRLFTDIEEIERIIVIFDSVGHLQAAKNLYQKLGNSRVEIRLVTSSTNQRNVVDGVTIIPRYLIWRTGGWENVIR